MVPVYGAVLARPSVVNEMQSPLSPLASVGVHCAANGRCNLQMVSQLTKVLTISTNGSNRKAVFNKCITHKCNKLLTIDVRNKILTIY